MGAFFWFDVMDVTLTLSGVMLWLRVTARISAVLLVCGFAAPALGRLWPSGLTEWMAGNRHRFTLMFTLSHTLHLAGIVMLVLFAPSRFSAQFAYKSAVAGLIGGGLVYILIYYMAWVAFARRRNPELPDTKWQTFGFYLLWSIFTLAFSAGVWRNAWIYAPLALVMWLALIVRIAARMKRTAGAQSSGESRRVIV
jgi:hypothetical protein